MGKPDWTKAHEDATHWDSHMGRFCNKVGYFEGTGELELLTDRYVERPTERDEVISSASKVLDTPDLNRTIDDSMTLRLAIDRLLNAGMLHKSDDQ